MGQKVNPHGARVGVILDWSTKWYAGKKDFSNNLIEDYNLNVPILIVNFKKIKWTFSDDDFNSDMVAIYKKVANMVNVLKRYIKKK